MKKVRNGEVYDRMFYYLLDWNDQDNWNYMSTHFNKMKLNSLTKMEFIELWEYATKQDSFLSLTSDQFS